MRDKQGKYTAYKHEKSSIALGVPDVNSGYVGYSMSLRAMEAYEDGEMPKSKWSKKAMLGAIYGQVEDEVNADEFMDWVSRMKKDEMFDDFFENSSWHHTSKYFNETDFYAVNEDKVQQYHYLFSLNENERKTAIHDLEELSAVNALLDKNRDARHKIVDDYGIRSQEYVEQAQNFCGSVKESGILDAPSDMSIGEWLNAHPEYREKQGERNGWRSQETESGYVSIGFQPRSWYSASYKDIPIGETLGDLQPRIRYDMERREGRVRDRKTYLTSLENNKETLERLESQYEAIKMEQEAKAVAMREKYPPFFRYATNQVLNTLKEMSH